MRRPPGARARAANHLSRHCAGAIAALCATAAVVQVQPVDEAAIAIDVSKVENRISARLYGQFAEFMFENIKFGLHAELLRNRGFEETADVVGLPRHWERHPDDRNDDAIKFRWDDSVAYPPSRPLAQAQVEHSLRIDLTAGDGVFRGISQPRLPIRGGVTYHGYVWLRTWDFAGRVSAALEQDRTGGETWASSDAGALTADGTWRQYRFTLRPSQSDPARRPGARLDRSGVARAG